MARIVRHGPCLSRSDVKDGMYVDGVSAGSLILREADNKYRNDFTPGVRPLAPEEELSRFSADLVHARLAAAVPPRVFMVCVLPPEKRERDFASDNCPTAGSEPEVREGHRGDLGDALAADEYLPVASSSLLKTRSGHASP